MGISYSPSNALVKASSYADFVAGSRCPDQWVKTFPPTSSSIDPAESNSPFHPEDKRLYELFEYGRFKILFLGKEPSFEHQQQRIEMQEKAEFWHIHAKGERVTTLVHEFQSDWVEEEQETVVVIRPDTYIGYVGPEWGQYLTDAFA